MANTSKLNILSQVFYPSKTSQTKLNNTNNEDIGASSPVLNTLEIAKNSMPNLCRSSTKFRVYNKIPDSVMIVAYQLVKEDEKNNLDEITYGKVISKIEQLCGNNTDDNVVRVSNICKNILDKSIHVDPNLSTFNRIHRSGGITPKYTAAIINPGSRAQNAQFECDSRIWEVDKYINLFKLVGNEQFEITELTKLKESLETARGGLEHNLYDDRSIPGLEIKIAEKGEIKYSLKRFAKSKLEGTNYVKKSFWGSLEFTKEGKSKLLLASELNKHNRLKDEVEREFNIGKETKALVTEEPIQLIVSSTAKKSFAKMTQEDRNIFISRINSQKNSVNDLKINALSNLSEGTLDDLPLVNARRCHMTFGGLETSVLLSGACFSTTNSDHFVQYMVDASDENNSVFGYNTHTCFDFSLVNGGSGSEKKVYKQHFRFVEEALDRYNDKSKNKDKQINVIRFNLPIGYESEVVPVFSRKMSTFSSKNNKDALDKSIRFFNQALINYEQDQLATSGNVFNPETNLKYCRMNMLIRFLTQIRQDYPDGIFPPEVGNMLIATIGALNGLIGNRAMAINCKSGKDRTTAAQTALELALAQLESVQEASNLQNVNYRDFFNFQGKVFGEPAVMDATRSVVRHNPLSRSAHLNTEVPGNMNWGSLNGTFRRLGIKVKAPGVIRTIRTKFFGSQAGLFDPTKEGVKA